jgi:hypothetical protein
MRRRGGIAGVARSVVRVGQIVLVACLVVACATVEPSGSPPVVTASATSVAASPAAGAPSAAPSDLTPSPRATPTARPADPPPDLSARPLVWLAPLPLLPTGPGREFTGSPDYTRLFAPGADWGAADGVHVLKLYGEWVAYAATDAELAAVVRSQRGAGRALAVEMGPLDPDGCGNGVEGFAGLDEARRIAGRIASAGGRIDLVAMDEPWFYGHVYDGPGACRWPLDRIARGVAAFEAVMRETFPGVVVGDTEALPRDVDPAGLLAWLDAYRAVTGRPLPFVHLDLDFGRVGWPAMVADLDRRAGARDVDLGLILFGDPSDPDDEAWFATLAQRVIAIDDAAPDHLLFQSWQDRPDRVLPAGDASTWTGFVGRYLTDPGGLAELLPPPNLAAGAATRASSSLAGARPALAVDGDPATTWSAGAGPPAWIELDLVRGRTIGLIRLRIAQFPEGRTVHRLLGRGPGTGGQWVTLAVLRGRTGDAQVLEWRPDAARTGLRWLRVETTESPSWVAWREIEVLGPAR